MENSFKKKIGVKGVDSMNINHYELKRLPSGEYELLLYTNEIDTEFGMELGIIPEKSRQFMDTAKSIIKKSISKSKSIDG